MLDKPIIRVIVDPIGNVKIEAENFVGEGCTIATKRLEEVLVARDGTTVSEKKPEFYEQAAEGGVVVDNLRL